MINIKEFRKENSGNLANVWDFNNINDLLKVVEIPMSETNRYSRVYSKANLECNLYYSHALSSNTKSSTFYFDTFDEALKALKYGWEDGRYQLESKVKELNLRTNETKKIKYEYNVVGGNACVPRYLQGIPTNMIKSNMVSKETKVINIYKTAPYTSSVSAEEILEDAAKTVIIVNKLEELGYKVNLYIAKLNENYRNKVKFGVRVKIKDAKMKLNLKKISFCIINPDMQRRMFWRLIELDPDLLEPLEDYGRGIDNRIMDFNNYSKANLSKALKKEYSKYFKMEENDIIIPPFLDDVDKFLEDLQIR